MQPYRVAAEFQNQSRQDTDRTCAQHQCPARLAFVDILGASDGFLGNAERLDQDSEIDQSGRYPHQIVLGVDGALREIPVQAEDSALRVSPAGAEIAAPARARTAPGMASASYRRDHPITAIERLD